MSLPLYAASILASLGRIALPGPNAGLIVATNLCHGTRYGLATVLGTTAAMLPHFVEPGPAAAAQMTVLAVIFLVLALALDSAWALLAGRPAGRLCGRVVLPARLHDRISASFYAGEGLGLAQARWT